MESRLDKLIELSKRFPTDKGEHGYMPFYALNLPIICRQLLEIGVAKGYSAQLWDEYFNYDVDLHILDLFMDKDHVSPRWVRKAGYVPHVGDQSDINLLSSIKEKFDVIIDDGSHLAHHMIITFKHLFFNNTKSGSQYYIEDCHTCSDPFWYGGLVTSFEHTALGMFQHFLETGMIDNPYFTPTEAMQTCSMIGKVEINESKKLILIKRR